MTTVSTWLRILALSSPFFVILFSASWPYIVFRKRRLAALKLDGLPSQGLKGNIGYFPKDRTKTFDFNMSLVEAYNKQGVTRIIYGPIPSVVVFDPYILAEILGSSKHTVKGFMYDFVLDWLGTGLLTSSGAKWKARRRLITPAFHFEVLKRYLVVMNEQTDIMISRMEKSESKEVDFFELIKACTLDIICETAMGKKVYAQTDSNKSPYVEAVYRITKLVVDRSLSPFLRSNFLFSLSSLGRETKKTINLLHGFTLDVIRERREFLSHNTLKEEERKAFLDILLTSQVEGQPLTDDDIREEVDTFMFEGHDTTSASLAWTIYLLGKYPEIQEKLREEVTEVMGDSKDVTIEMTPLFKYMELILKESLRVYPSVPSVGRYLTEDTIINNVKILKGTNINVNILGLHHNPRYWDDPHTFKPERWLEGDIEKNHPYLYIPFSAGQRNCIGQQFAKNEEKVILAKVIKNFRFTSLDQDLKMVPELILRPNGGVRIKIEKISS